MEKTMRKNKEKIETANAPSAIGPYSQAIVAPDHAAFVFVSGQLPIDPKTGKIIDGDIKAMTRQVIHNLEAILKASGSSLENIVRTDVFLTDLKRDFPTMNEEYAAHFKGPTAPARQTVQVSALPLGSPIEISCIAFRL
jgi:2-iminobutanoate/2-iminopropanoate deaminase